MQIFLMSKSGAQIIQPRRLVLLGMLIAIPLLLVAFFLGSLFTSLSGDNRLVEPLHKALGEQSYKLEVLQQSSQSKLNALAVKLAELQSHVLRLNAVGRRMVKVAGLDEKEFDFSTPPAVGSGKLERFVGGVASEGSIQKSIDMLFIQLQEKELQLSALERLLPGVSSQKEFKPAGRPIKKGWLSSYFGKRTDPFTGRKAWHQGVDFAGKEGSGVVAMASGIVTWASDRHNYGQMVEIDHGKGYVTRYGHNKALLVKVGDRVRQGEVIAKMGSTGRSTGPHVHLEVLLKGKKVNPVKFIRASR